MKDLQLKENIKASIKAFFEGNLTDNGIALFDNLGYITDRQAPLDNPTYDEFKESFIGDQKFDEAKAKTDQWLYVDLLFQLSAEEITKQNSLFNTNRVDDKTIESYLFFVVKLSGEYYNRTDISVITREINRLFPMPVMILFNYDHKLTLSVIDRRLHKKDESKDVLEKVTLIKDINIENPHRAHIEILYDLSYNKLYNTKKFSNFVELHKAWQETLDTKELNKRFFNELANWYFWAISVAEFPDDELKDKEVRNATNVIRLITRLIFVWFLKEKNLVPAELFNLDELKELLKFSDKNQSTYYKAILQNLFFATLNTEMGKRKFRSNYGNSLNSHYFIHNLFRYESQFIEPQKTLEKYFDPIPFLNGGLFECLDKQIELDEEKNSIRIDGFSDRDDNVLKVPDELFFTEREHVIDLSDVYGSAKKNREKVRGLIDILNRYKFTITENTPIEEEVALDPELLGKVFENLLANYNPETKTTARKQTGSFYTPREIVNYMVDESLIAYFKQKIDDENAESDIRDLISYTENPNPLDATKTGILINAIDDIKILDPACGSGAFPMGILHKLVHVLHKIDPGNEQWEQRQLAKVDKLISDAETIPDTKTRENVIADLTKTREDVVQAFENNELNYGRKLFLIENCLYGVDIQPIAVQIAKLRFFISLIVEQHIDRAKYNLGVRPLPNLETKFVAANTLIALEKEQAHLFTNPEIDIKKDQLKNTRHEYFEARTPKRKENCRLRDKQLRNEIADLLITEHRMHPTNATKLAAWDPYNQNTSAGFFDPEWMFSINDGGFDVVIGNPPWIQSKVLQHNDKMIYSILFKTAIGQYDLFNLFIEKGISILGSKGRLIFITPDRFITNLDYKYVREYLLKNTFLKEVTSLGDNVFENVAMPSAIIHTENLKQKNDAIKCRSYFSSDFSLKNQIDFINNDNFIFKIFGDSSIDLLLKAITEKSDKLIEHLNNARGVEVGKNSEVIENSYRKGLKKFLRGEDIDRYTIKSSVYIDTSYTGVDYKDDSLYKGTKILIRKTGNGIIAVVDDEYRYAIQTIYIFKRKNNSNLNERYVLGCLNSKLLSFYYNFTFGEKDRKVFPHLTQGKVLALPILNANETQQQPFITLVDQILATKKDNPKADTSALEKQIDELVYQLYNLTEDEIAIIENSMNKK